jgi:hypothetical protein
MSLRLVSETERGRTATNAAAASMTGLGSVSSARSARRTATDSGVERRRDGFTENAADGRQGRRSLCL